jgi:hypothetical protein
LQRPQIFGFRRLRQLIFGLRDIGFRRFLFWSRLFAPFSKQFEKAVDPLESATLSRPAFHSVAVDLRLDEEKGTLKRQDDRGKRPKIVTESPYRSRCAQR